MGMRARTDREKREIVERLYRAWTMVPSLRFGQLLSNALANRGRLVDIYYVEDAELAGLVERMLVDAEKMRK